MSERMTTDEDEIKFKKKNRRSAESAYSRKKTTRKESFDLDDE
jgi:hypothetical protein